MTMPIERSANSFAVREAVRSALAGCARGGRYLGARCAAIDVSIAINGRFSFVISLAGRRLRVRRIGTWRAPAEPRATVVSVVFRRFGEMCRHYVEVIGRFASFFVLELILRISTLRVMASTPSTTPTHHQEISA
ncbi:hypothetical protein I7819_18895 [Burkholderia multivorans]|uniref:hypothetical protein n=1 Tax=Burkholderia multivorans TaxID=87883 RepID=UPI0019085DA6|nr:hypothetical protein [Burkholderia multivorans]MBJ9941939.1 hypothetical protein [Burkholderia multivorans]MBU9285371.1 hypothetical protein [Burkholderia multivorans]